jgi:hypothetical protein
VPEETTLTNAGTISGTMQTIENDANMAATVGAALGGPVGAAVDAGLQAVEGVVNTVVEKAPHQTALTDIGNAVAAAAPVINQATSALAPAAAAKVVSGMSLLQTVIADIEATYAAAKAII